MPDLHQENKAFILTAIRNIFLGLLDILYPRHCFACDRSLHEEENSYICEDCLEKIKKVRPDAVPNVVLSWAGHNFFRQRMP